MKSLHTLLILLASTSLAIALPDFRWSKWGDTQEQVQLIEPVDIIPLDAGDDLYTGVTTVASTDMFLVYQFIGNKLTRATYYLRDSFETAAPYWSIYYKLEGLLNAKYGLGVRYHGYSAAIATWTTPATTIWLTYDSGSPVSKISLSYTSHEFNFLTDTEFEMAEY